MTDPTPPAAPRPCECGHDIMAHFYFVQPADCLRCDCTSYRPVSPEAAPREHPTAPHLCGSCFYDKRDCVCVTGPNAERTRRELHDVPAPPRCELLVGATSETCDLATGHPGDCSYGEPGWRSDNEHDAEAAQVIEEHMTEMGYDRAEAAPPRATTEYCNQFADAEERYVCRFRAGHDGPHHPHINRESSVHRAPLAAHPATTPEPMTDTIQSHDVRPFVRALARSAEIIGAQEGLDTYLLASAHLLNWYAEQARASSPSRDSGALHAAASDLRHVASGGTCAPETLRAHADALLTLERDAARMREALGFYADPKTWKFPRPGSTDGITLSDFDLGNRARAALTPSGEPTTTPETSE